MGGVCRSTGAQPLYSSRAVCDKSRYDKLTEVKMGFFHEYRERKSAGVLRAVRAMFIRIVCVSCDRRV